MNHKHLFYWGMIVSSIFLFLVLFCMWKYPQYLYLTLFLSFFWNLLFGCMLYFIHHTIVRLSRQLLHLYTGNKEIPITSEEEGVLSILENDMYKLIRTYREQNERSAKDRLFLVQMLNDISHQLKTPITSMQMMSELLTSELPGEKRIQFGTLLQKQIERLQWLVSSLLKLSQLDVCAIVFHKERIALEQLIRSSIEPIRQIIQQKNLQITIKIPDCYITTDPKWSKEAILNIIKNAVEHTGMNGHIHISATTSPLFTSLTIKDDGEGMDLEDQAHIFERFYRGKNASSDSAGIGMAMAKAILNAQQTDIQVASQLKEGTCFTILFPVSA